MKRILYLLSIVLCGGIIFASVPLFQGRFEVESVDGSTNTGWRVGGKFEDGSLLGWGASDCATGDVLYSYSSYGDVDCFSVTQVVVATGINLTVDVKYDEPGTPRAGAPQAGYQIICRRGDGVAFLPSITFGQMAEYLQNAARNISLKYAVAAGGGGGAQTDPVAATNYIIKPSAEQILNEGATITPFSNARVNNTNGVVISLGNPQIATNVSEGMIMILRGVSDTKGIQLTNGAGVVTDCAAGFLIKSNDIMQFVFMDGQWNEVRRLDK